MSGLSTAVRLLEAGFKVRIVTRERTPNTTSDIAAAVWYPFRCGPPDRALLWSRRTFRALRELARDPATGVTMVPGIDLREKDDGGEPWWKEAVDSLAPRDAVRAPDGVRGRRRVHRPGRRDARLHEVARGEGGRSRRDDRDARGVELERAPPRGVAHRQLHGPCRASR